MSITTSLCSSVGPLICASNITADDHTDSIAACRALQERLRPACFQGFAFGFLEHGQPTIEYIKAFDFCGLDALTPQEKSACFEYISFYLGMWYTPEKARTICEIAEEDYRVLCHEQLERSLQQVK